MHRPRPTPQALRLKEELVWRGLAVESEFDDHGFKHVDLAILSARLYIEIDGSQHYEDPFQILSDLKRSHYSDRDGFDTLHIPNTLIDSAEDLPKVADAIAKAVRIRRRKLFLKRLLRRKRA